MTKKLRGTKNPTTLRHLLPIAVAILLVASMMLVGAASAQDGESTPVAKVSDQKYETLQAAIDAAGDGDTVTYWKQLADTSWYNTIDTEFVISTPQQLAGLDVIVEGGETFEGKTIKLDADIDLASYKTKEPNAWGVNVLYWEAIGYGYSNAFRGTFDGQGHTISNLYSDKIYVNEKTDENFYKGLFGRAAGTFKNLKMHNVSVFSCRYAAALVACGWDNYGNLNVEDITVTGKVIIDTYRDAAVIVGSGTNTPMYFNNIVIDVEEGSMLTNTGADKAYNENMGSVAGAANIKSMTNVMSNIDIVALRGIAVGGIATIGKGAWKDVTYTGDITTTGERYETEKNGPLWMTVGLISGKQESSAVYTNVKATGTLVYSDDTTSNGVNFYTDVKKHPAPANYFGSTSKVAITITCDHVAEVDSVGYDTLLAAIEAAEEGQTVTVLSDAAKWDENFFIPEGVTIQRAEGVILDAPEGYKWNENTLVEIPYVAQIGETKYETLQAAVDAANAGETVTLLDNVVVSGTITIDKAITLDLDGKTISADPVVSTVLLVSGDATINDGSVIGTKKAIEVTDDASLTISDSTVTGGSYGIFVDTTGKVTINNTDITGGSLIAIHIEKGTAEFNGGTLTTVDGDASVRLARTNSDIEFIMNGGTINGWVDMWGGTFEMHGGTINAKSYTNGTPCIYGAGTFIMTNGYLNAEQGSTVIQEGGTFGASMSGGTLNTTVPDDYIAEGYVLLQLSDDKYIVTKLVVAQFIKDHLTAADDSIITEATADTYEKILGGESDWNTLSDDEKATVNAKLTEAGGTKTYPELLAVAKELKAAADLEKAQTDAKAAIDKAAIDALTNLSDEKRAELIAEIKKEADEAKTDINNAETPEEVTKAKDDGIAAINKIAADAAALDAAKTEAKAEINQAADDKKAEIDALPNLSSEVKAELKEKIDTEATAAKNTIDSATTSAAVTTAKNDGITVINGITTYTITVTRSANGVATAPATAKVGETVTVTVTPETEYQFSKLNVTTENGQTIAATGKTFIMPAENVSVNAEFTKILLPPSGGGYSGGSSIWLTETPTPSETPTPTETIPTEIPTVIPTEDEPKSGSYLPYIIAVLGVLAVLIIIIIVVKRRSDDEEE